MHTVSSASSSFAQVKQQQNIFRTRGHHLLQFELHVTETPIGAIDSLKVILNYLRLYYG